MAYTLEPDSAKARLIALPMPRVPPVTTAVFWSVIVIGPTDSAAEETQIAELGYPCLSSHTARRRGRHFVLQMQNCCSAPHPCERLETDSAHSPSRIPDQDRDS